MFSLNYFEKNKIPEIVYLNVTYICIRDEVNKYISVTINEEGKVCYI